MRSIAATRSAFEPSGWSPNVSPPETSAIALRQSRCRPVRQTVNEVEDADGKDEDKGTDKQADVQMQVARDEIKASHQEGLEPEETVRRVG